MNVNIARVLILLCAVLFVNTALCANKRGCLLNDYIYNVQLADVGLYRNAFYTQYYENFSSRVEPIKASEVAYWNDPNKCVKWGYIEYLGGTDAQKTGCLINGNERFGTGRPIEYELVNYCNVPLDDSISILCVTSASLAFIFLRKQTKFMPPEK
jgi:hypothetical protein